MAGMQGIGGGTGGNSATDIVRYVAIGLGRQTEAYGAWYEGEANADEFQNLRELNTLERDKDINLGLAASRKARDAAKVAYKEVDYQKGINTFKSTQYKKESRKILGTAYSRMAKGGVRMDYGSPLDYINDAVTERAKGLDLVEWSGRRDVYMKEVQAAELSDKATIMLYETKVNASLFAYKDRALKHAKQEATRQAKWRQFSAYLGAVSDVFGGSNGGMQGSGGGGGYNTGMVDMNSGWSHGDSYSGRQV